MNKIKFNKIKGKKGAVTSYSRSVPFLIKSKKGIGFGSLITPVLFILFGLYMLFAANPLGNVKDDVDFGSLVVQVDKLVMEKPAKDFFRKLEVNNSYLNTRKSLVKSLQLANSATGIENGVLDPEKMVICKLDDVNLWYNEIGVDLSDEEITYSNCLPEFGDVDSQYLEYYKDDLESSFIEDNTQVVITPDNSSNDFTISIEDSYFEDSKFGEVVYDYSFKQEVSISSYSTLLEVLGEVIPKLSNNFKKEVPICLSKGDYSETECMENIFEDSVKKINLQIEKEYYFEIDFIDEVRERTENKYFGINVDVFNTKEEFEFTFGLILKDTIPYAPLRFGVNSSNSLNNFINVNIEKPAFENEVSKYLIMYSYEDFLSTAHPKNYEFIKILERGEIPTNMLTDTSLIDHNSNKYFYSNELDLTVLLSGSGGFAEIEGKETDFKTVPIYQIFNTQTRKFELINSEVYVYVFALDENYNLFINNIQNTAKSSSPADNFGPLPPKTDQISLTGEIMDRENSLSLIIRDYVDSSFDHFDIYILEQNVEFVSRCDSVELGCYFFDGWGTLTKDRFTESGTFSYLITSMDNVDFPNTIYTNQFSNDFNLENGKSYDVYIIPENNDNIGFTSAAAFKNFEVQDEDLNFQILSGAPVQVSPVRFDNIKIMDKKSPTIEDVEILDWNVVGDNVYLQWKSIKENDIKELNSIMTIKTNEGQTIGPTSVKIGIDGKVLSWKENYNRIELDGIDIIDYSGNIGIVTDFGRVYPQVTLE